MKNNANWKFTVQNKMFPITKHQNGCFRISLRMNFRYFNGSPQHCNSRRTWTRIIIRLCDVWGGLPTAELRLGQLFVNNVDLSQTKPTVDFQYSLVAHEERWLNACIYKEKEDILVSVAMLKVSGVCKNVNRGGDKVWSKNDWWGGRGALVIRGGVSPPLVMGIRGCNPGIPFDNWYVVHGFEPYFMVKFI